MNSKVCLVFLYVAVSICYGQFTISSTGAFQATSQCSNSISQSAKEQCLLNLCRAQNPSKFECQALSCKVSSPGQGIQKKKNVQSTSMDKKMEEQSEGTAVQMEAPFKNMDAIAVSLLNRAMALGRKRD